jgi:hypothetical protein
VRLYDFFVMISMKQASRIKACLFAAVLLFVSVLPVASQPSITVTNGFELHAALASGSITQIYVAANVSIDSRCTGSTSWLVYKDM